MRKTMFGACALALLLFGCSLKIGTRSDPEGLSVEGLAGGYASLSGIRPYDGTIIELDFLKRSPRSGEFEVASVEVWPVAGLAVGLVGARAQLFVLDVGAGVLAYRPKPPEWKREKPEPEVEIRVDPWPKAEGGPEPKAEETSEPEGGL